MMNFRQIPNYFMGFFRSFKNMFTKPQFDNFERLVSGFVLSDNTTIQEISSVYGDKDQSSLNRFVTKSDWDLRKANKIRLNVANNFLGSKEDGILIFDDTMAIKTGKKMEMANHHRSGKTKETEWGHSFVDSVYTELESDVCYPIDIQCYIRECDADAKNIYKPKRNMVLEQIDFARECKIKFGYIMADSWYYSKKLAIALRERGLKYFLGVKSSLTFSKNREKKISVGEYVKSLEPKDYIKHNLENGTYFLHTQEISIRGDGKGLLLVSYKEGDENNLKCYLTNQFGWENKKYMKILLKRWGIECLHRDNKQHLGLEEYQVRKFRGLQAVALAVLCAYTLLAINKLPKILQKFRPLKTIGEMCRFAQLTAQKSRYWMKKIFNDKDSGARILNQLVLVKNAKV